MSSPFDDHPIIPASANPSQEEPGSRLSLEDGLLDRYVLGALRPEEEASANVFFAHRLLRRVPSWLRDWAERDADADAPSATQNIGRFWEHIRDHGAPMRVVDYKYAQKAVRNSGRPDLDSPHESVLGKQTLRTAYRKEGVFSGQTLRRWTWSAGAVGAVVLSMLVLRRTDNTLRLTGQTYLTSASQQGTLTLRDGTRITLAPNTTLHVQEGDRLSRMVDVQRGEAYFDVARSSDAPFVVRSGPLTTRVLGTAFLIRNDTGGAGVRIAVAEGKVRVSRQGRPDAGAILGAGQVGELVDSTIRVNTVEGLAPSAEWLRDRVVFHDTQVATVLAALSRWYGYQFRCVDSSLSQKSVTIMVSMQSSASALATLEQILRVNLTVIGDTVTLAPQHTLRSKGSLPRMRNYDVWTPMREVGR